MTDGLDGLLEYVRTQRGFDFTGYKRATLERRVAKRMQAVGVTTHADYLDFLEVHPDEYPALFDTLLINVSSFFRDPPAWEHLRRQVVPAVLAERDDDAPIRVWSAACASGQEAYSLAMVLAEALGEEQFLARVKVYATDVDEAALGEARLGVYPLKVADAVPDELGERFLERTDHRVTFRRDLRRALIFGRNDLVQDAPISRVDLLTCRNTLMYFNAETQARILRRLHFALRDHGVLFLGKSEMLVVHTALFTPLDAKCRVFAKVPRVAPREEGFALPELDEEGRVADGDDDLADASLREGAWHAGPLAQVVVDATDRLAMASQEARKAFGLRAEDLGRRFSDLELSYRPVELRSAIETARAQRAPTTFSDVEWHPGPGDPRRLEVVVQPILSGAGTLGSLVSFRDVTQQRGLHEDLERSRRELEVAYEELQSTVEELETTNEELQSTNEELETMNEELQSTNEEMDAVNEEMRRRSDALDRANAFLGAVLTALGLGVVAVDGQGLVRVWNQRSQDLWGLRPEEVVGRHALGLDIGLPMERLAVPLRAALAGTDGRAELEVDATNRRGRPIRCRVVTMPLAPEGAGGAVVLVEEL